MGVASCSGTYKSSNVDSYHRREGSLPQLFETQHTERFSDKNTSVLYHRNCLCESETTSRSSSGSDTKTSTVSDLKNKMRKSRRSLSFRPSTFVRRISSFHGKTSKSHCKPGASPYIPKLDAIWLAAQEAHTLEKANGKIKEFPNGSVMVSLGDEDSTNESLKVISEDDMKWEWPKVSHLRENSVSSTVLLTNARESPFQSKLDSLLLNLMLYEIDSTDSFDSN